MMSSKNSNANWLPSKLPGVQALRVSPSQSTTVAPIIRTSTAAITLFNQVPFLLHASTLRQCSWVEYVTQQEHTLECIRNQQSLQGKNTIRQVMPFVTTEYAILHFITDVTRTVFDASWRVLLCLSP